MLLYLYKFDIMLWLFSTISKCYFEIPYSLNFSTDSWQLVNITYENSETYKGPHLEGWPPGTGKSLSEALIFASLNPQYDNRLFMELPWKLQTQNIGKTCSAHVLSIFCACSFHGNSMNNLGILWPEPNWRNLCKEQEHSLCKLVL